MSSIPTTLFSHVVDQATLSTMQAEMIAVQVLSQSASGDIQYFQQQPHFMTLPAGTDASALSALQATLSQMPIAAIQMPMTTQGFPVTAAQAIQLSTGHNIAVTTSPPLHLSTIATPGIHTSTGVLSASLENHTSANQSVLNNAGQASSEQGELSTIQADDVIAGPPDGEIEEDGGEVDSSKAKYTCELCGKNYIRSWSYYGHMREHASGDKQHKCEICGKVFNYASNLRQHMLIHTGEKPYECEYCEKAFNNPSSLRSHMMSHSDERPYICDHEGCNKSFNNPGSLRVHRRVHQEEKPHPCTHDDCDKAFKTPAELARHAFRHSGEKPHKCDQCDKAFIRYDDLKRHYRIHTGEKPFKCDECDFACIQSFDLVKHKFTHSGDKPYKCDICPKQFTRPARLRDHMRTHTGEKPFVCEICGKGFAIQTGLKSHLAVHTGDKPFKCLECEKTFRTQMELQSHMGRHTGVKPFKCDECQKEFISAVTYKRHAVVHSGEKPFECPDCGRRFARSTDLKVHMPVHSEDKPYKCGECEKMFTRFSTLKEHIRTHTGERPFKCDDCGREFNHRSHFNNHLRIHTGEKPFSCDVCGKDFSRKASLRYHMKVHENSFSKNKADEKMDGLQLGDNVQVVTVDGQTSHAHFSNEDEVQLAEALVAVSESANAELEEAMHHQGGEDGHGENAPGDVQQVMEVHSTDDQSVHGGDTVVQVHTVGASGQENIIHASNEAVQNLLQQVIQTFVSQPGNHLTQSGHVISHDGSQGQTITHIPQEGQQQLIVTEIQQGEESQAIESLSSLHQQVQEHVQQHVIDVGEAIVSSAEDTHLSSNETAKTLVILGSEAMVSTATTQPITIDTMTTIDASQIDAGKVQEVALPTVMSVGHSLEMGQGVESTPEAQMVELQNAAASVEEQAMETD